MSNNKAFTLIELLVTISVAGILIAIAVPSFSHMIIGYRLNTISAELAEVISFARSESIKRNKTITFCRAATETSAVCADGQLWTYWIIKQNASGTAEDDVIKRGSINSHNASIQVTTKNITGSKISVNTDGLARSGSTLLKDAQISVCATSGPAESIRVITLGAASQVSITKKTGVCS
ncbi:GspH/FimT family pseudopilin [Denitrificimonas caeni]|uniref:GspH/FimT family pseudopilin n=1 Tax=Denitrificimonas caeni TaxID=521720 RepID=UPI0019660695|nr:GspH/FimT family pseudopilin [Denitrificimonas caeni]